MTRINLSRGLAFGGAVCAVLGSRTAVRARVASGAGVMKRSTCGARVCRQRFPGSPGPVLTASTWLDASRRDPPGLPGILAGQPPGGGLPVSEDLKSELNRRFGTV